MSPQKDKAKKSKKINKVCRILGKKTCSKFIYSAIILFAILLLTILGKNIISLFVALGLLILGSLSSQFVRMLGNLNLGVEFIPFVSIMFFYAFGFPSGMLAALIMMIISLLLVGRISIDMIFSIAIFVIIGLLTFVLDFGSIATNGIILIIIFNVLSLIVELFLGLDIVKNIVYFLEVFFSTTFCSNFLARYYLVC